MVRMDIIPASIAAEQPKKADGEHLDLLWKEMRFDNGLGTVKNSPLDRDSIKTIKF